MRWRRVLGLDEPQETRVFLFVAAFGLVITVVYWVLSQEVAGTVLLLAFTLATGAVAGFLVLNPAAATVRDQAIRREGGADLRLERKDRGGGSGTSDVERPFLDEAGRIPAETFAPFAVGLGAAIAATAPIFGAATLLVGILPFLWGAWSWLRGATDELEVTSRDDGAATRPDDR